MSPIPRQNVTIHTHAFSLVAILTCIQNSTESFYKTTARPAQRAPQTQLTATCQIYTYFYYVLNPHFFSKLIIIIIQPAYKIQ